MLDLGCGPAPLLEVLVAEPRLQRLVALDTCPVALEDARARIRVPPPRLKFVRASFAERHEDLRGFDAAVLLETIEHLDPAELSRLECALFAYHRPGHVVITTPNIECNPALGVPAGRFRHPGHRFEWTRAKFGRWAAGVAERNGYAVTLSGVGPVHPAYGQPTQIATFDTRRFPGPVRQSPKPTTGAGRWPDVTDHSQQGAGMRNKKNIDSEAILRSILGKNPRASLHEIRRSHPVFQTMSYDHLTVRVSHLVSRAGTGAK